ncbi:MAG: hypothetical protein ACOC2W_02990 [bacterium]
MESLEKNVHISELYDLNHRNDNDLNIGYNYKDNVLKDSLSKQLFNNDITNGFILHLQKMVALTIDSNVILRNWFNHTVSKFYDRHSY